MRKSTGNIFEDYSTMALNSIVHDANRVSTHMCTAPISQSRDYAIFTASAYTIDEIRVLRRQHPDTVDMTEYDPSTAEYYDALKDAEFLLSS